MDQNDIEELKARVSCAALLERWPPVWRFDRAGSSRHSRKYRRGPGEILIINHDGRGWWDPLSERKGDVVTLLRMLEPGLSFGAAGAARPRRPCRRPPGSPAFRWRFAGRGG